MTFCIFPFSNMLARFACEWISWIAMNHKIFLFIMYFKGLILKFPQMRWAPTCNNREASGMAYGEYEDDFWSRRARLFFKSRPAAWWAATCSRQAYTHSLLHTHRRPFQATFLSSIFFQTGDKKLQQPFPILHLHGEFCVSSFRIMYMIKTIETTLLLIYCFRTIKNLIKVDNKKWICQFVT